MTTGCSCGNGSAIVFAHADTCQAWNNLVNQEAIDTMPDEVAEQVLAILNKMK